MTYSLRFITFQINSYYKSTYANPKVLYTWVHSKILKTFMIHTRIFEKIQQKRILSSHMIFLSYAGPCGRCGP